MNYRKKGLFATGEASNLDLVPHTGCHNEATLAVEACKEYEGKGYLLQEIIEDSQNSGVYFFART